MASGITSQSIINKLVKTRKSQFIKMSQSTGLNSKKAESRANVMEAGFKQAIHDLVNMGVIELVIEE